MNIAKIVMVVGLVGLLVAQTNVQADDYESNNRAKQGWKAVAWKYLPWALAVTGIGFGVKEKLDKMKLYRLVTKPFLYQVFEEEIGENLLVRGKMEDGKWVEVKEEISLDKAPLAKLSDQALRMLGFLKKVAPKVEDTD